MGKIVLNILQSFPKRRSNQSQATLYPISSLPEYPNAQNVLQFLKQSRITETTLSVEHVESLLNVLVLDGEIERVTRSHIRHGSPSLKLFHKIPAFGASLWDSRVIGDDPESESERHSKNKRKHRSGEGAEGRKKRKSTKRQDTDTDPDDSASPPRKKKSRRLKREDSDSDDEPKRKRRKSKARDDDSCEDEGEYQTDKGKKRPRSRSKKSKSREHSEEESTTASSGSESDSDGSNGHERSRSKPKASKSTKRSTSPALFEEYDYEGVGTSHVYRAIRPERAASGWSQTPCTACPSFDFCDDSGPVNATDCIYYSDWLGSATVAAD